jgi:hypothetical protein
MISNQPLSCGPNLPPTFQFSSHKNIYNEGKVIEINVSLLYIGQSSRAKKILYSCCFKSKRMSIVVIRMGVRHWILRLMLGTPILYRCCWNMAQTLKGIRKKVCYRRLSCSELISNCDGRFHVTMRILYT